jgi:hydrogenase maturation protease
MLGADSILIIGYGNELRGDDAAGPRAASALAAMGLARVQVLIRHQLVPELSEALSQARAAIFVDASCAPGANEIAVQELKPSTETEPSAHASDPRALLALAQAVFGHCPPAWLLTIPGTSFDLGAPLSPLAQRGVTAAVARLQELARSLPQP